MGWNRLVQIKNEQDLYQALTNREMLEMLLQGWIAFLSAYSK